jgi:hypothetical protein
LIPAFKFQKFLLVQRNNVHVQTSNRSPGKYTLVFCTFSGPHTGVNEATTTGKYIDQFFEHIGFTVIDEWYVLSEFHGREDYLIKGRMDDIR